MTDQRSSADTANLRETVARIDHLLGREEHDSGYAAFVHMRKIWPELKELVGLAQTARKPLDFKSPVDLSEATRSVASLYELTASQHGGKGEVVALIDERLADLRKANDVFREMDWDKSSDIQRNDREIRWLIDFRTILLTAAPQPPAIAPFVAWIAFASNGNIRFWTSDEQRAKEEKERGLDLRAFTLAELVALVGRPRGAAYESRNSIIEECAKVAEAEKKTFLSPEYASNQPFGSLCERFACDQVAEAIRALAIPSTGGGPAA